MPIRAVLFDIDGTLIDSNDLHAQAWDEAFRRFGQHVPLPRIRGQIGKGGDNLLPALLPADFVEAQGEALERLRGELFKADYLPRVRPFPGVHPLFERLRADGRTIVLASSGKREEVDHHIQVLNVADLIDGSTTADDAEHSKPDPDIFAAALKQAGAPAAEAVVVGDTPYDVVAAAKLALRTIALRCGGFDEGALREAGALELWDDPADLLANYERSALSR